MKTCHIPPFRTLQRKLLTAFLGGALATLAALPQSAVAAPAAGPDTSQVGANVTGAMAVDEASLTNVIHVDMNSAAADDAGPGTQGKPLKTFHAGMKRAVADQAAGKPTRLVLHPGVYREAYVEPSKWVHLTEVKPATPSEPWLVIEAAKPGTVTISGAEPLSGWTDAGGGVWTRDWPISKKEKSNEAIPAPGAFSWDKALLAHPLREGFRFQTWPRFTPMGYRPEGITHAGVVLRQVLERAALTPGKFWIDDANSKAYLMLREGTAFKDASVEVTVRQRLLQLFGKRKVALRGLAFVSGGSLITKNSTFMQSVQIPTSTDILIEDCRFDGHSGGALGMLRSRNVTFRRTTFNDNGWLGFGGSRIQNMLVEDCESSRNHWRGEKDPFEWGGGSFRINDCADVVIRNHKATGNYVVALYFDTDTSNLLIDRPVLTDNFSDGIFLERNQGPNVVRGATIINNWGSGIELASRHVTIENSVIVGNGSPNYLARGPVGQISFAVHDLVREVMHRGTTEPADEQYQLIMDHLTLRNNIIASTSRFQPLFVGLNNPEL